METAADVTGLVDRLVHEYDLPGVAASACAAVGIHGHDEAVAYCLVALVRKADPVRLGQRRYRLDVGAEDFPERLYLWAQEVARNLARWAATYGAIQDEADRYEITTLRRFVRTPRADDHIDQVASRLMTVLSLGPSVAAMQLDRIRDEPPPGNAYVFQTALSAWVAKASSNIIREPIMDPIDHHADRLAPKDDAGQGAFDEVLETEAATAEEDLQAWLARVARLGQTRELLRHVIERADQWEAELAARRPERREDGDLLVQLRAALLYVADRLRREQAAVTGMLAFLVLAMRPAAMQQQVAVLSLRVSTIDPDAAADLRWRMHEILEDVRHPTPLLVDRTRSAVQRQEMAGSRLSALEILRDGSRPRDAALTPVAERLTRLPAVVEDNAAIAKIVAADNTNVVKAHRSQAAKELAAIDVLYGAVFRRYAMGRAA